MFSVHGQQLLGFVTDVPDSEAVQYVREMARRLGAYAQGAAAGVVDGPGAAVATSEVLGILGFLAEQGASLKLLENTGIGEPVAQLSRLDERVVVYGGGGGSAGAGGRPAGGELQHVRQLAASLAASWWELSSLALQVADAALDDGAHSAAHPPHTGNAAAHVPYTPQRHHSQSLMMAQ
jgi:hypothetical protein